MFAYLSGEDIIWQDSF